MSLKPILALALLAVGLALFVPSDDTDGATEFLSPQSDGAFFHYESGESVTWRMTGNGFTYGYRILSLVDAPDWLTLHIEGLDMDYISGTAEIGTHIGITVNWEAFDAYGNSLGIGRISVSVGVVQGSDSYVLRYVSEDSQGVPETEVYTGTAPTLYISVTNVVPTRTLHTFKEWNTQRDGQGQSYSVGDSVPVAKGKTVTLYAIWESVGQIEIDLSTVVTSESVSLLTDGTMANPYTSDLGILWSLVPQGNTVTRDTVSSASGWVFMPHIGKASAVLDWLRSEGYWTGRDAIDVYLNGAMATWDYEWTSADLVRNPNTVYYSASYVPTQAVSLHVVPSGNTFSATVMDADGNPVGSSGDVDGLWMVWGSDDHGNWPGTSPYITSKGNYVLGSRPTVGTPGVTPPFTDQTINVDGESSERVMGVPSVYYSDGYWLWSVIPLGTTVNAETTVADGPSGWIFMPYVSSLDDVLTSIKAGLEASVVQTLEADGGTVTLALEGPMVVRHDRWYDSGSFSIRDGINLYRGGYRLLEYGQSESAYATIDYSTGLTFVYSAADTLLSTGNSTDFDLIWGSDDLGNMPTTFLSHDRGNTVLQPYVRVSVAEKDVTHYMDPTQGVTVTSSTGAQWSNGYDTASMTVAFRCTRDAQERVFWGWDGGDLTMEAKTVNGTTRFTVTSGGTVSTYNLGMWRSFEITIDLGMGTLTVKPIVKQSWRSFMDYETLDHPVTLAIFQGSDGAFTSVIFYRVGTSESYTQSVVSTKVLLDTYGVVLYDASLDISLYWPEMTDKRLNFYSFSLYGTSVTINGMTYPVDPNTATITVGDTVKTFSNVYLTYPAVEEGETTQTHVVLTFVDDGTTIDLGPLTTYTIEFGGMWYFQTGLWEGHPATRTVWTWDPWTIDVDAKQLIFMFDGILALVTMGAGALMRDHLTLLDGLVIVSAFALSLSIIGVW